MNGALPPSQPSPDFSSADVQRAYIGPAEAGRILLEFIAQGQAAAPPALLAQLLKAQFKSNCRYTAYPFSLIGASGIGIKQILPENPVRISLILNFTNIRDIPTPRSRGFLFEPSSPTTTVMTAANLAVYMRRALVMEGVNSFVNPGLAIAPGFRVLQLIPPPINAVSIVNTAGTACQGVVFEGV
jgi:hypothetical protein